MTPGDVLDELIAGNCDPLSRRRVEAMVLGMAPGDLEGMFLALPVLDGIARHELHGRAHGAAVLDIAVRARVDAALALHHPDDSGTECAQCTSWTPHGPVVTWPCPTARALGVES